jgi:hypothetical protein
MSTELLDLYQQLGQLVWGLFQKRATESLLIKLTQQQGAIGDLASSVDATLTRIDALKASIASVLAEIQQHPNSPDEPLLLKRLRALVAN